MNRRWWLLVGVVVLCCAACGRVMAEAAKKPNAPRWLTDFEEGRKAAQAGGKPLFVVFRCEH